MSSVVEENVESEKNDDEVKEIKVDVEPDEIPQPVGPIQNIYKPEAVYDNPTFEDSDLPGEKNTSSYQVNTNDKEELEDPETDGPISRFIQNIQQSLFGLIKRHDKPIKLVLLMLFVAGFYIYLGCAIYFDFNRNDSWCHGAKFLLIITVLVHLGLVYHFIVKKVVSIILRIEIVKKILGVVWKILSLPIVTWTLCAVVAAAIILFVIIDSLEDSRRLISASGVLVLLIIGYVFSTNPSRVKWRPVLWGLFLQFMFALIILRWSFGQRLFGCIGDKVKAFLEFTDHGSAFVFNYLVSGKFKDSKSVKIPEQFPVFAFKVLPVIIFFNACTAVLYYLGAMQVIVKKMGWLLNVTIGTTVAESMNAAGNIFLGMTEAPLVIAPFMPKMTSSELHSVMTGGFATIAGGIMAAYINFGIEASHLLSASVMSAPAALGLSKLLYPETKKSDTDVKNIQMVKCEDRNMLEAAARGASQSISLIANIVVNLIAFLAFIHFIDSLLSWFGNLVNYPEFSFEFILSKVFVPLATIMGVDGKDAEQVARLVGLKTIVNEFVAYAELGKLKKDGVLSPRSEAIATYALCGFSNLASIGIQIGALGALAPTKKPVLAKVALRAMITGSMACFMTACIAGTLIQSSDLSASHAISQVTNPTVIANSTL